MGGYAVVVIGGAAKCLNSSANTSEKERIKRMNNIEDKFIFVPMSKLIQVRTGMYETYSDYSYLIYLNDNIVFFKTNSYYALQANINPKIIEHVNKELLETNKDYSIKKIAYIQFSQDLIKSEDKSND